MCLAVPGKVLNVDGADPAFRSGNVDFCGVRKTVNLAFTPEVQPGDFVLVHVGFAITRIDEEEARRTFAYLKRSAPWRKKGWFAPQEGARRREVRRRVSRPPDRARSGRAGGAHCNQALGADGSLRRPDAHPDALWHRRSAAARN